jgi:hypothetical protein
MELITSFFTLLCISNMYSMLHLWHFCILILRVSPASLKVHAGRYDVLFDNFASLALSKSTYYIIDVPKVFIELNKTSELESKSHLSMNTSVLPG